MGTAQCWLSFRPRPTRGTPAAAAAPLLVLLLVAASAASSLADTGDEAPCVDLMSCNLYAQLHKELSDALHGTMAASNIGPRLEIPGHMILPAKTGTATATLIHLNGCGDGNSVKLLFSHADDSVLAISDCAGRWHVIPGFVSLFPDATTLLPLGKASALEAIRGLSRYDPGTIRKAGAKAAALEAIRSLSSYDPSLPEQAHAKAVPLEKASTLEAIWMLSSYKPGTTSEADVKAALFELITTIASEALRSAEGAGGAAAALRQEI